MSRHRQKSFRTPAQAGAHQRQRGEKAQENPYQKRFAAPLRGPILSLAMRQFLFPRFTADDAHRAHREWGANCGPTAIAAICRLTLDEVRHAVAIHLPSDANG